MLPMIDGPLLHGKSGVFRDGIIADLRSILKDGSLVAANGAGYPTGVVDIHVGGIV